MLANVCSFLLSIDVSPRAVAQSSSGTAVIVVPAIDIIKQNLTCLIVERYLSLVMVSVKHYIISQYYITDIIVHNLAVPTFTSQFQSMSAIMCHYVNSAHVIISNSIVYSVRLFANTESTYMLNIKGIAYIAMWAIN